MNAKTDLQALIKDILAHCEGHSVTIHLDGYFGQAEVVRKIAYDRSTSFVEIYINKTTDICAMHTWAIDKTSLNFSMLLDDAFFAFKDAIEEAISLWNIYKATNL